MRRKDAKEEQRRSSMTGSPSGGSDEEQPQPPTTRTPAPSPYAYPDYDDEDDDDDDEDDDGNLLEIVIETLTGTTFHVRVSPWETGAGLKGLLQRTQGLPSTHQHILLDQTELTDEAPLIDQGVQDGASLRLVLAMKGGPLNSRRMPPYDDSLWKDFTDFMDVNREELWDSDQGRPVTLLVLREGDAVNLYRVVENEDGTFSPLNESWSSHRSTGSGKTDRSSSKESLLEETIRHQQRMAELSAQMEAVRIRKHEKKEKKMVASKPSSPRMKVSLGVRTKKRRDALSQSQRLKREGYLPEADNPAVKAKGARNVGKVPERPLVTPSGVRPARLPPVRPTPRLGLNRSFSTPARQELSSGASRPSISRGSRILDELPKRPQPRHVEFSHHPKLESIRTQRSKGGSLHTLEEDIHQQTRSRDPEASERGESSPRHCNTYREALVRHGKKDDLRKEAEKEGVPRSFRHAWSGRDAPYPLYSDPCPPRRPYYKPRLNHSHNVVSLHPPRDFDDRPKTSPEILGQRPSSAATSSTMSDRIQLRAPDEKLKELITILNISRASSCQSNRSTEGLFLPHQRGSTGHDPPKGRSHTRNRHLSGQTSLTTSIVSLRGSTPPSVPSTSGGFGGALQHLDSQDRIDALRDALKSQPSLSRRSTPDGGRNVFRRPGSGQFKAMATPKRKSKKLRPRCQKCQKKLGVVTSYSCRCGHVFCAQHRYAETHDCSFDYKATGKKLIEIANPLVVPPKLPKI